MRHRTSRDFACALLVGWVGAVLAAPAVPDLADAELGFAAMAQRASTRAAFLEYLAPDAVVFAPGPVQGRPVWERQADDSSTLLSWYPQFALVSASGDLGCTYGPWSLGKRDAAPSAHGHFMTIWKRDTYGPWRVALDDGMEHAALAAEPPRVTTATTPPATERAARLLVDDAEHRFSRQTTRDGYDNTVLAFVRPDALRFRDGLEPLSNSALLTPERSITAASVTLLGSATAVARDLAYAYGEITEIASQKHFAYVHVWRATAGTWRLAIDRVSLIPPPKPP
jgi:ketosteroid isomerase-like protein